MTPEETARRALARYYVGAALIKGAGETVSMFVDLNGHREPWFELTTPDGVRVRVEVEILDAEPS